MKLLKQKFVLLIIGITLGVVYGIIARLVLGNEAALASTTNKKFSI